MCVQTVTSPATHLLHSGDTNDMLATMQGTIVEWMGDL